MYSCSTSSWNSQIAFAVHKLYKDITFVMFTAFSRLGVLTQLASLASLHLLQTVQVLELGIVAHSVIIGVTLGVSESPCTIRPLLAALSFHQFFEGFALGGCIAQVGIHLSYVVVFSKF